jgi:hypothetical protein
MVSDDLKREAIRVWNNYGDVVVKAFSFPGGSIVDSAHLERILESTDEEQVRNFISHYTRQAEELARAKFLGE